MKKIIILTCLILIFIFSFTTICFGASAGVNSNSVVSLGDTFDVILSINDAAITSSSIKVEFSSSLEYLSYDKVSSFTPIVYYDDTLHQGAIMNPTGVEISGNYLILKFKAKELDKNAFVKVTNSLNNGSATIDCEKNIWIVCKNHNYPDWTIKNADCVNSGLKSRKCSECGYEEKITLNALGHDVSEYKVVTQATCTKTGLSEGICQRCKQTLKKTLPITEHTFGDDYTVIQEGSLYTASIIEYKCINCGQTKTEKGLCTESIDTEGLTISCNEGVFPENSLLMVDAVETITNDSVKETLENLSSVYDVYDIFVLLGNEKIQPNGELELKILLSEKYSSNVCLVYLDDEGNAEIANSWRNGDYLYAKITHLSTYAVVDLSAKENESNESKIDLYIEITEAIIIVILIFLVIKKGKENEN